jgi:hypothetical protein
MLAIARGRRLARDVTDRSRAMMVHALDLPSHRDLQLLDAKVERLQRTLDEWAAQARDHGEER